MSSSVHCVKNPQEEKNVLHCPESYIIKEEELLPFLLDMPPSEVKKGVKPSQILAALELATEERLEKLRSPLRKYKLGHKRDPFRRCPEVVIFQNFNLGVQYHTTITIMNQRTISQNLKVHFEPSRFFTFAIDSEHSNLTRMAPGMCAVFRIYFLPADINRDYIHEVRFDSGDTQFSVKIYALGSRSLAYMPDKIILPPTLVKVESSQTMMVKNKGEIPLNFSTIVSEPFSCNIKKGIVPRNEILEVKYSCYSTKSGYILGRSDIYVRNITITIELECEVKNLKAELNSHLVTFDDVYVGLCSGKTLSLRNTSDFPLNFAWKMNDQGEEEHEISKFVGLMEEMKEYEQKRYEKLKYMDIIDGEGHAKIYERIFHDEKQDFLQNQTFLYNSEIFEIIPKVGMVLPRTDFEFFINFIPRQNIFYYSTPYLDIEGSEKRIRVSLQGYGVGPPVMLTVKNLNAGQIYVTDKHQYELAVINKGVISATVSYQPKKTDWGGILTCIPETLHVSPDSTKALIVAFYSELQGDFIETLDFKVEESGEHLQCVFSGNVICPLLKCVPELLEFGTVCVGISVVKELVLVNDSRVSIKYDFEFEDDFGATGKKYIEIIPRHGKVEACSSTNVQITFSCDENSEWATNLLLVMWNSRMYMTKIPLTCKCDCPKISCKPEIVRIKFCFLNADYYRTIELINETSLPGYVKYVPNKNSENNNSIVCVPHKTKLYFNPHETIQLSLKINVFSLGPHNLALKFSIIGGGTQTLCTIFCNGQGPVVSYFPDEVHFGVIDVLRRSDKKLTLVNDSPIPAKIHVYCKSDASFHVEESDTTLELNPEEQRDVTIWALFNSPGKTKDVISIDINQGDVCTLKVYGEGFGTSILCEPPLEPLLKLGTLLTYKSFTQEVKLTNKGKLRHKLLFTTRTNVRSLKENEDDNIPTTFKIVPSYLEIESDQTVSITLNGTSLKPKAVSEEYFCYALIGKSCQVQSIIHFFIEANFVDPNLTFSKANVDFKLEIKGNVAEGKMIENIQLDNMTGIPLQIHFNLDDKDNFFTMVECDEKVTKVGEDLDRNSMVSVNFCPTLKEKRRISQKARIIVGYEDHPKTDIINLHGEVIFPTVKLHPSEVNFHCVPLGSTGQKHVVIQNVSAMMVYFKWYWLEQSVKILKLNPVKEVTKNIKLAEDAVCSNVFMQYIDPKIINQDESTVCSLKESVDSDKLISGGSDLKLTYDPNKCLANMNTVLSVILSPYKLEKKDQLRAIAKKRASDRSITKLFSIEPSEGHLKPDEYSIATIGFNPPPNTDIMATAICKIKGGEEEHLLVRGKSYKLSYVLDKNCVNFGNQVFCEMCSDNLILTNNGLCNIDFKVLVEELMNMESEMIDVNPRTGCVTPDQCITFKIDYFPGFPGNFNKFFMLELGYLEPVVVNVRGYGVVSQVFLRVPRLDMMLDIEDSYKAVAWITPEYLELVQTNDNSEMDDEPRDPRNFLEENDWVYVSYNDLYPSLMDIDMAMERIAAFNLVSKNPKVLKDHNVTKIVPNIPQFFSAPYCVDFGHVVRGMPVCYTVLMYNYGPTSADIRLIEDNKTALVEKEFKIEFKTRILAPGETLDLYVIFAPTKKKYSDLDKQVEDLFRLSVKHGPIITVQIKAEVTLPIVSLDYEELYFANVYCGDVLRKTIILNNNGTVQSKWAANISKPTRKGDAIGFFVIPNGGELDPGKKTYLQIYFVPTKNVKITRILRIDVELNSQPIYMNLYGEGVEPSLMIVPTELKFSPTLSYFEHTMYFAVQNMAEIPMEFYFPTMDCDTEYEKLLIRVYLKYKNLKQIFIPLRLSGQGLPDFFSTTYNGLVEKLKQKMLCTSNTDDNENQAGSQEEITERKINSSSAENEDPLAKFSPKEINSLLMEYITAEGFENNCTTNATSYRVDDLCDNIEIIEPLPKPIPEEIERKGILFIVHGAPTTDYFKIANQIGIALSVPVYSIDRLIIQSLVEETHQVSSNIMASIENAFSALLNPKTDAQLLDDLEKEDSEYDKILDKINIILSTKRKKEPRKGSPKDKESKVSSEKSYGKNKDKPGTSGDGFPNISSDYLVELLKPKLKRLPFLVIESLHSTFMPQPNSALYAILKAAGCLQYIGLVIFSSTMADFVKNEEIKYQRSFEQIEAAKQEPKNSIATPEPLKTEKRGKASTKAGSEKVSKGSYVPSRPVDITKKILQNMNKTLKVQLEEFESLRQEIWHVVQHWDKRNVNLKKSYISGFGAKKDTSPKDSGRTARNSVKKPSSNSNLDEPSYESGLNLWVILNSSSERSIDFSEMVRNNISRDLELQRLINEIEENQKEKFEESEEAFSVISKPSVRRNEESSIFTIRNVQGKDSVYPVKSRSKSGSSIKVRRKRSSKGSRKSSDSRIGGEVSISFAKAENDLEFSPKSVLYPGELMKYQVSFCPRRRGQYKYTYTIETTRSKTPYQITCSALCEFPAIDLTPEVMFPRTLENYREKASYDHFVFIKDQKIFDFGSIIAGSSPEKCLIYSSTILLRNVSSSNCDISVSLSNDVFCIEPSNFIIPCKGEGILKVSTKSTKLGTLTAQLYISIKNNPKVEEFTLACSPCKLEFIVHPRTIAFDKVPLSYTAKRVIKLTNTSPIDVRWEFVEPGWVSEMFNLSRENGYISLYSVNEIVFRFHPKEEVSFPKRYLPIRVFDVNSSSTEPCYTDSIVIHADSVEYNLSVDDHIDFGEIKGGVDHKRTFSITNKGKCEVILKIEIIHNPLEGHNFVREYIKIHPLMLVMGSQKTDTLSIAFHPTSNFSVSNILIFVVSMVESMQTGYVVKSYKVTMNATCFMPSYKLCPQSVLKFGYVPLLNSKRLTLELTNKGKFSFSFVIQNYLKMLEAPKKGSPAKKDAKAIIEDKGTGSKKSEANENTPKTKSKDGSKGTSAKTEKSKVAKLTQLTLNGFTITPASGIVNPNDKFVVNIEFTPSELKEFEEKILINIAEIADVHKNKVVTLEAIGCEPKINLKDFNNIFAEQYIVSNIEDFALPKNVDGCCVFSSSSASLYFKLVCIGTSLTTKLHFKNIGYVTSNVAAKIDDSGRNVFSVSPLIRILEPHLSGFIEITFTPESLQEVHGSLEISYNSSMDNKLVIQLSGQGCLPQIKLLKPEPDNNDAILNFGPICVGFTRTERVTFKNVGQIKCKVIVELATCDDVFTIVPASTTFSQLNVQKEDYIKDMRRDLMVNLLLDEIAAFDVVYKPTKQESIQVILSLHIVNNPYEINKIIINGTSFDDDVIIEELEPFQQSTPQLSGSSLVNKNPIGYFLDLGYKQLNKLYRKSFLIRNRSNSHTYKFRFYCSAALAFTPEVGHLKPAAFKEVLVIFKATTPVSLKMVEITCNVSKIHYLNPKENELSWDDRQKLVYWMSNVESSSNSSLSCITSSSKEPSNSTMRSIELDTKPRTKKKIIVEGAEPEIVTLPDSLQIISLYLTVIADYCQYQCETTIIDFEDTYVKEESSREFNVKNSGIVPINVTWSLSDRSSSCDAARSSSETSIHHKAIETDRLLKSSSSSSLFSSSRSTQNEERLPIQIHPEKTVIEPEEERTFSVSFFPQEENSFQAILKSNIDALGPNLEEISIEVNANALSIPFYFEMEDGSSTNKNIILDFENIGLATDTTRTILLVNPNDEKIYYEITAKERGEFSYFACENPRGTINKRKKCPIAFNFFPPIFGSFKENYLLEIAEKNVQRNVSLQGLCREPKVYFTETNCTLKSTIPKVKTTKSLKLRNDEAFPVSFKFLKKSLFSECQSEKLEIYPVVGRLKPQNETDIKIVFTTLNIVSTSFHVKCLIEKLKSPLNLHISVRSIKIQPSVSFTSRNGEIINLSENKVNILDLGYTHKGRKDTVQFRILNQGDTGMFYAWEFDSKPVAHLIKISVDAEKEFIKSGHTAVANLIFDVIRTGILKQFKINLNVSQALHLLEWTVRKIRHADLKFHLYELMMVVHELRQQYWENRRIMYGPVYTIHVNAISDKPSYSFSFNSHNFGYCLTQTSETNYYNTVLCFKNLDSKKILVENVFENTAYLTVDFSSSTVLPGEVRHIPIKFHPQHVGSYKSEVLFLLGGIKHTITVFGEAANINLELCNPKDKFINFGDVLVGTSKKYRVGVYNNSPAKVDVHFDLFDNLMVHQRRTEKLNNEMKMPVLPPAPSKVLKEKAGKKDDKKKDEKPKENKSKSDKKSDKGKNNNKDEIKQLEDRLAAQQLLKKQAEERNEYLKSFTIIPNIFIDIPPRGKGYFDIVFRSNTKTDFQEKIYLEIQDYIEPFCVIKGSSIIPEFSLDIKEVLFTGIVIGCSSTQLITLKNTGDVIGSFNWKIEDKRNIFAIEPKQGFVLPKNDIKIKITFCPKSEKCSFKVKAKCLIKEFKETLDLLLKGNSVKIPEPTSTITFKCNVREKVTDRSVTITNNTSEQWLIQNEISQGSQEAFSVPNEFILKPFSSDQIVVTYLPKNMFLPKPDEGKLFVKLPDGSGLLYNLIGNVEPPAVKEKIEREIRCKQNFFEIIPVENWLTTKQTFKVITEVISPVTTKTLYKIFGFKTIELNGMESVKYKWGVYVVNEGPIEFRVTFKSRVTGEYEFYEISLKALPSEPTETIIFKTRVREPITKQITLENPVDIPVIYVLESTERNLVFSKSVNMEPYTSAKIDVTYTPLQTENTSSSINAKCEELGTFTYLIKMQSEPPRIEDPIIFTSEFGAKATKTIVFKNTSDRIVEFSYKFNSEQFYMERCTPIPAGDSSKIVVAFEPYMLGHAEGNLCLASQIVGEFVYPLEGEGIPPTPKGPYTVKSNYPATIEFKNPYNEDKEFQFYLYPDIFYCDFNEDVIKSKKTVRFLIYLRPEIEIDFSCRITGKLIVYSADKPDLKWKYYLQLN